MIIITHSLAHSETVSSFHLRHLVDVAVPHAVRQPEQSEGSFSYTVLKGETRPLGLRAPKPAIELKSSQARGMYSGYKLRQNNSRVHVN